MKQGFFIVFAAMMLLTACQQQNQAPQGYAHFLMGVRSKGQHTVNDPYAKVNVFFEKNCKDPQVDVRVVTQGTYSGSYEELEKLNFLGKSVADSRAKGCGWYDPTMFRLSAREKSFNGTEKYFMTVNEHGKYQTSSIAYQPPVPTPQAPPSALEQIFSSEENFNRAVVGVMVAPIIYCQQNPNDAMCQSRGSSYSPPVEEKKDTNSLWEDVEMYEPIEEPYYAPPPAY